MDTSGAIFSRNLTDPAARWRMVANTPRLEQPPVDPRIPLAGFTFNPASQLFEDSSTGYVFDPAKNVFTNLRTRHEYTYDTESRLFRPRAAALQADAVSLKGIVSGIKLPDFSPGLKQELESGTEAFNSFLSQLSSRFTPRKSYESALVPMSFGMKNELKNTLFLRPSCFLQSRLSRSCSIAR